MKIHKIPMSCEEFEMMEHPFGWKAEYDGDNAIFTPREYGVNTKLNLTPKEFNQTYPLRSVNSTLKEQIIEAFFETFQDSVEYFNWSIANIKKQAIKTINNYFAGVRGEPLPVSVMSIDPDNGNLIGLALLINNRHQQTRLDLLFVKPLYQRKKIATQMVASAINQLYNQGIRELYSTYHLCNEISQQWHHSMGFEDIYDQYYIRLKYSWYRQEIWRHQQLSLNDQIEQLIQQRDYWYNQLEDDWR